MKTAEQNTVSVANNQKAKQPFFSKEAAGSFFSESKGGQTSFFKPSSHYSINSNGVIQTKLTIGQPDDKYEQEADAMADKVVQRLATPNVQTKKETTIQAKPLATHITPLVQAKCATCEQEDKLQMKEEEDLVPESPLELQRKPIFESNAEPPDDENNIQRKCAECEKMENVQTKSDMSGSSTSPSDIENTLHSSKGSGSPLPAPVRMQMETSFGANFSGVRIHNDSSAVQMSKGLNAQAFTHGSDIYFNSGKYDSTSRSGQHLLAHELTHTIQQGPSAKSQSSQSNSIARTNILQKQEGQETVPTAGDLISKHESWINLDEEALGKDVARYLPAHTALAHEVLNQLGAFNQDDVSYEITMALKGSKLSGVDEGLRVRLARIMANSYVVDDDEEGAIRDIWVSFEPSLPDVAERHKTEWKKSLWESDQLTSYTDPIRAAFKWDVEQLALKFLAENKQQLIAEAEKMGVQLEGMEPVSERPGYLDSVRAVAPNVVKLQTYLTELKDITIGTESKCYGGGRGACIPTEVKFNPEMKPGMFFNPGKPTWEEVKTQYDRVSAIISSFAGLYPSLYILIQQGKLEALTKAGDDLKAREIITESMRKTLEKINQSDEKVRTEDIEYYDLVMIQSQLFSGSAKRLYDPRYDWSTAFYKGIAEDELKAHEARDFWTSLGLSLLAAAALIAAPFTGGLSAAFLIGFGLGVGGGQAALSWEKYEDLKTLSGAEVTDELGLVSQGQVDAQLLDAIIQTVGVFLDAYGAKAATGAARASRAAVEAAEKEVKQKLAEETRKKMVRDAAKEGAMIIAGTTLAIGMHELADDEPVPDFTAQVTQYDTQLPPDVDNTGNPTVNRFIIQLNGGGVAPTVAPYPKTPILLTGNEFELYIERALLAGGIGDVPKMNFVIPGQYTGSGWGIDRIGIVIDDTTGKISLYQLEMKFVQPGSTHVPELGIPSAGTQTGEAWTKKAIDGFLTSQHPKARAGRERLRRALQKLHPSDTIDIAHMRTFLQNGLTNAPVRIFAPSYADLRILYRQAAALVRWGRGAKVISTIIK